VRTVQFGRAGEYRKCGTNRVSERHGELAHQWPSVEICRRRGATAESDPDVDPAQLAAAELAEETGYHAGSLRLLGDFYEAYGYCNQKCHVFEATGLTPGETDREHTESDMRVARVSADEFRTMVRDGRIKDGPTIAAYGLLALE
jgi:8-oxo-dGTP pyrophosphatase MutT (NUDIX family)